VSPVKYGLGLYVPEDGIFIATLSTSPILQHYSPEIINRRVRPLLNAISQFLTGRITWLRCRLFISASDIGAHNCRQDRCDDRTRLAYKIWNYEHTISPLHRQPMLIFGDVR
jgi:hypothetical protein